MTTVVFYKGVMVADTLQTTVNLDTSKLPDDEISVQDAFEFKLVNKIQHITINGVQHLIGLSGDVNNIVNFLAAYRKQEIDKFKPTGQFRAIDYDQTNVTAWYADPKISYSGMFLNLILPFLFDDSIETKWKLKSKDYKYDKEEETAYAIGSGGPFVQEAYTKIKFQFERLNEKIEDHLSPIEVATYLVKVAALCDMHTNNKLANAELFTSVSPQLAKLSKE